MKVLVTGATGFVGTALVGRLVRDGFAVLATCRGPHPAALPGVQWLTVTSIADPEVVQPALAGCDAVVHLAALAHQTGAAGAGRWTEFQAVNVDSTRLLARWARAAGVRRLVFMSSVAAVCSRHAGTINENTPPDPDSDYGRSKLQAESVLTQELQGSATDWCAVRPPLVYGPGNPGNMARLAGLIRRGLPLPFGAINNRRSFIYIDNLVDALMCVLRHPGAIARSYFVSDGSNFSTPQLIRALGSAGNRPVRLWPVPVMLLRVLGWLGDAVQHAGARVAFDTYSIDRLVGSIDVSGALFEQTFHWQPPVEPCAALRFTAAALASDRAQ